MMAHFYDSAYWHGDGAMTVQARRLLATLLALTDHDFTLPAPHIAPITDFVPDAPWRGFFATWYGADGGELTIHTEGDILEIEADDAHGVILFQHDFSNKLAGQALGATAYQRYSSAGLTRAVEAAQHWFIINRDQLGTMTDSIRQLFFGGEAHPREAAWEADWGAYADRDRLHKLRQAFCLAQATHDADTEAPFFTHAGLIEEADRLQDLSELNLEWLGNREHYRHSSIELFGDGDIMFHTGGAESKDEPYRSMLSRLFGTVDPEAQPPELGALLDTIRRFRELLCADFPIRVHNSSLFHECGLTYDQATQTWFNEFAEG